MGEEQGPRGGGSVVGENEEKKWERWKDCGRKAENGKGGEEGQGRAKGVNKAKKTSTNRESTYIARSSTKAEPLVYKSQIAGKKPSYQTSSVSR